MTRIVVERDDEIADCTGDDNWAWGIWAVDREEYQICNRLYGHAGEYYCTEHYDKRDNEGCICNDWPTSPDQLISFPECGYRFREINRKEYK